MARRTTVYNKITTDKKLKKINPENLQIGQEFLDYKISVGKSPATVNAYKSDLNIFWVWNLDNNDNKLFVDVKKRDLTRFQNHCLQEWNWSPSRLRRVKSCLSSLSDFIENMLDDDYEGYRPIIKKIESPKNTPVRDKIIFTEEQLTELLDYLVEEEKYDQACMLSLCMNNGRRKAELPRLKASYFTDENVIFGSIYKSPEKIRTKGNGKYGKMLDVYTLKHPFDKYLHLWLDYRKKHNITSDWLVPKKVDGEYINEPVSPRTLDGWAKHFSRFLGVPFYWHSLRHYFTTACSRSGLPDGVIKQLVGWESLEMVELYKDISAEEQLAKYFDANGIKKVEQKSLADL